MTLENILSEKTKAMKTGDKTRVKVLNDIIVLVQKEQTKGKVKVEATEEMVAACAAKEQKMLEEMVATCPGKTAQKDYTPLLEEYKAQLAIATEYAPKLITNPEEIARMVIDTVNGEIEMTIRNKGQIMRIVMPTLKGKTDMAVTNKVIGDMLK